MANTADACDELQMPITRTVARCALCALATPLAAQLGWTPLQPLAAPPARAEHAMVAEPTTPTALLFGGSDGATTLGDTWRFDGSHWTQVAAVGAPPARRGHVMATCSDFVLLYGGEDANGTLLDDTWQWRAGTWSRSTLVRRPLARTRAALAKLNGVGVSLLFGGHDSGTVAGDTWLVSGVAWAQQFLAPAPAPRQRHAIATGLNGLEAVLFGGLDHQGNALGDTWTYRLGTGWIQQQPAHSPSPRAGHAMALDAPRSRVTLFGGSDGAQWFDELWDWDGSDWTLRVAGSGPAQREAAALVSLPGTSTGGRLALFGGRIGALALADTWSAATAHTPRFTAFDDGSCPRAVLRSQQFQQPWLGSPFTLELSTAPVPTDLPLLVLGLSDTVSPLGPLPLRLPFGTCTLLVDPAFAVPMHAQSMGGDLTLQFPDVPALRGLPLFAQGVSFSATTLLLSHGVRLDFGVR